MSTSENKILPGDSFFTTQIETARAGCRLGLPVRHFEIVDSTNREAERWALAGAPEGALVTAEHQTSGRGRLNRIWHDLHGESLLFSLILRPCLPPAKAPTIAFPLASALAETLCRWLPRDAVELKWPNDVLVRGRKTAGILLESRCTPDQVKFVVAGIGLNVGGLPNDFPDELRKTCETMRHAAGKTFDRIEILCAFLDEFENLYGKFLKSGLDAARSSWNSFFRMSGKKIKVTLSTGTVTGTAGDLGPDGTLPVRTGDGRLVEIFAGDVELCREDDNG